MKKERKRIWQAGVGPAKAKWTYNSLLRRAIFLLRRRRFFLIHFQRMWFFFFHLRGLEPIKYTLLKTCDTPLPKGHVAFGRMRMCR